MVDFSPRMMRRSRIAAAPSSAALHEELQQLPSGRLRHGAPAGALRLGRDVVDALLAQIAIEVYRFDFSGMEWARVDGLGTAACSSTPWGARCRVEPTRWGGGATASTWPDLGAMLGVCFRWMAV
ncbi:uncharacterized protein M6B38_161880 [Iris pallida]|uniref:Uncharacterized protein n=1 Tax=Iris pallida TaxID=29817 RepID=A0AAX6EZN6_IRIPA|nr:uncharacterized protein M6B38_161880 [Iris pallida]